MTTESDGARLLRETDGLPSLLSDILRKYGGTMKGRGDHDIYDALVRYRKSLTEARAAISPDPIPAPEVEPHDVRGHFPYHEYPHPTDHSHHPIPAPEVETAWDAFLEEVVHRAVDETPRLPDYAYIVARHRPVIEAAIRTAAPEVEETPESVEAAAGALLVKAARLRRERLGPNDAHELRHLLAAVEAGNSDPCDGGAACHRRLDGLPKFQMADWPGQDFLLYEDVAAIRTAAPSVDESCRCPCYGCQGASHDR